MWGGFSAAEGLREPGPHGQVAMGEDRKEEWSPRTVEALRHVFRKLSEMVSRESLPAFVSSEQN